MNSAIINKCSDHRGRFVGLVLVALFGFCGAVPPAVAQLSGLEILTTSPLPVGMQGVTYNLAFQATNGVSPYIWSATKGVPSGLGLTSAGLLTGKPLTLGTTNFSIIVRDSANPSHSVTNLFSLSVTNPLPIFMPVMGTYTGLILQTNPPTYASSGYVQIVLTKTGSFVANIALGGLKTAYAGQFDPNGNTTTNNIAAPGVLISNNVGVTLAMNLGFGDNRGTIVGTVTGTNFTSILQAELPETNHTWTGRYTLALIPADVTVTNLPQGYGYATLNVAKSGIGTLTGLLCDGTPISETAPVSQSGLWPFYLVQFNASAPKFFITLYQNALPLSYEYLYGNPGACISWVTLTSSNATGVVDWFILKGKGYSATNTTLTLEGAPYTTGPLLNNTWTMSFSGAGLTTTNLPVVLSATGKVVGANPLTLKVTPSTGQFSGSLVPKAGGKAIPFTGLLLQNQSAGYGLFQTTNGTTGWLKIALPAD